MSEQIAVKGRELKAARVGIVVRCGDVVIRIDDDARPEFWLTLVIPVAELERLALSARQLAEVDGFDSEQ